MAPANELFRSRLESNPALITRASVQWLDAWSGRGMADIGKAKLMVGAVGTDARSYSSVQQYSFFLCEHGFKIFLHDWFCRRCSREVWT